MQSILALWSSLDTRRRAIVLGSTLAVFGIIVIMARLATQPSMALLYAGLENAAAGEIVQNLDARGVIYEVRGDAIYVPQSQRDELRLMLAAAGLPANAHSGYELLDQLSGFGTTSQMFDAAYWRAKEGELARTIIASPHIRHARVHLTQGGGNVFRRDGLNSASVTITPVNGAFSASQARAIHYLVASAVAGLQPEDVAVIDATSGLVYGADSDPTTPSDRTDRAAELRRSVERLLDAHVGHGRAVVEVSVETITDREVIHERRLDPDQRVATSTETEESTSTSSGPTGQGVTVASNLPDGDAAQSQGNSESRDSQTRARNTFDVSETRREIERLPGAIRKLSVAVLIDGTRSVNADGVSVWSPRQDAELSALRELVASAVGFDEGRGDVITLRSLPFEPIAALGTDARPDLFSSADLDIMTLIKWLFLLMALLAIALFVVRPILQASRRNTRDQFDPAGNGPALLANAGAQEVGQAVLPYVARAVPAAPADDTKSDPVARLRALIAERQGESVELLRHWMDEQKEQTTEGKADAET